MRRFYDVRAAAIRFHSSAPPNKHLTNLIYFILLIVYDKMMCQRHWMLDEEKKNFYLCTVWQSTPRLSHGMGEYYLWILWWWTTQNQKPKSRRTTQKHLRHTVSRFRIVGVRIFRFDFEFSTVKNCARQWEVHRQVNCIWSECMNGLAVYLKWKQRNSFKKFIFFLFICVCVFWQLCTMPTKRTLSFTVRTTSRSYPVRTSTTTRPKVMKTNS